MGVLTTNVEVKLHESSLSSSFSLDPTAWDRMREIGGLLAGAGLLLRFKISIRP
jgi:hypothetical protein